MGWSVFLLLFTPSSYSNLPLSTLQKDIFQGRVHVIENWIPEKQLDELRELCFLLEKNGLFKPSGLSYTGVNLTSYLSI
jgi:hypothetical protein